MPRAAVLSIHARVRGTLAVTWQDPSLVQVWGPRFSAYVVPERDAAVFTLGRCPEPGPARTRAEDLATRLDTFLAGRRIRHDDAGHGAGVRHPNELRYGTLTGRIRIFWDGARQATLWTVPPPAIDPRAAWLELARRHLRVFGPSTPQSFSDWAGIALSSAQAAFVALARSLTPVRTPIGDSWLLTEDVPKLAQAAGRDAAPARLLPSGDTYFLLQGAERHLLEADASRRAALWTSRVWPGALLVRGEVAGTWRRAGELITLQPWRRLGRTEREAVEVEALSLPLPEVHGRIRIVWSEP